MDWINILIQGGLLGGFYALFAIGLSMSFGIMRLVNIAHGDLIVLVGLCGDDGHQGTGLDPFSSLIIVMPVMFVLGYALQRGLLNQTLSGGLLPPLLVTFGISIIIQNGLLQVFGAYDHRLQEGSIETASLQLPGGLRYRRLPASGVSLWQCSLSRACSFCFIKRGWAAPSVRFPTTPTPPN